MALTNEQTAKLEKIVRKQTAVCIEVYAFGAGKVITPKLANAAKESCDAVRAFNKNVKIVPKGKKQS